MKTLPTMAFFFAGGGCGLRSGLTLRPADPRPDLGSGPGSEARRGGGAWLESEPPDDASDSTSAGRRLVAVSGLLPALLSSAF